ncbi:MAG: aminotransferase class V-fold PLP-dependent enzyme [Actinomycetes bacterium]
MTDLTRDRAEMLDASDPLAYLPGLFVRSDPNLVYLDGNSLGMLPRRTRDRLSEVVSDGWGSELVRGWHHWISLPGEVGDRLGSALLGARPGQVLVTDTITVNLYKLAAAALGRDSRRRVVVSDARNFPTDRFALEGVAEAMGGSVRWINSDPVEGVSTEQVAAVMSPDVGLVALQHVDYRGGAVADVPGVTGVAHEAGALVLWDLAHSAGAVPIELDRWGVDLAVGCTYKYLNSGPGAPGFLYVRQSLHAELHNPIRGWWAQPDLFAMDLPFSPAADISRFLTGTQSVLGLTSVDESVAMLAEVGIGALRQRSISLVSYLVELVGARLEPLGFVLRSPTDPLRRGGHIVVSHPDAPKIASALVSRADVVPDVRPPDLLRLSPSPASSSFVEVWEGVTRIAALVESGGYADATVGRVT